MARRLGSFVIWSIMRPILSKPVKVDARRFVTRSADGLAACLAASVAFSATLDSDSGPTPITTWRSLIQLYAKIQFCQALA